MSAIPYDVWENVAAHIPKDYLRDLISVNRAFYDLGMKARYRNVELNDFDEDKMAMLHKLKYVSTRCCVRPS